jgi:hypothetical protein
VTFGGWWFSSGTPTYSTNKILNMNWDYVCGKKKQKENKNNETKRKQTNKNK